MMKLKRKQRALYILALVSTIAIACALILYALRQNINLYFTPSQLVHAKYSQNTEIRLGGWVKVGSVKHAKQGLGVDFVVTDHIADIAVHYSGVLPALFCAGQGVVVQGVMFKSKFAASTVLAKHSADYRPPEIGNS